MAAMCVLGVETAWVPAGGAPSTMERQEVLDRHAPVAVVRWDDDANTSVVVEEDLAIASAWRDDTAPSVADRHDRFESASAVGSGRAESNQFSARAAGEVVKGLFSLKWGVSLA